MISGLRRRRTGSEYADRRVSARRLRDSAPLSPSFPKEASSARSCIVFSVTVSYPQLPRFPYDGSSSVGCRAIIRPSSALEGARRFVRTQRRADAYDARGGRPLKVPRRPTSERDRPHMPYMTTG